MAMIVLQNEKYSEKLPDYHYGEIESDLQYTQYLEVYLLFVAFDCFVNCKISLCLTALY